MKSITEFTNLKLENGIKAKTALAADGKTPEEIAAFLGEQFKYEGEKLKCFVNAVEIAEKSAEKLFIIKVARLNEGQNTPAHGKLIEDLCYIAEPFQSLTAKSVAPVVEAKGGNRGGRPGGNRNGKPGGKAKESPWGISPEEKEAKLAASRQAAREKSLAGK